MKFRTNVNKHLLLATASACMLGASIFSAPAHAIVPNDNQTPDDILDDETDVTGVGAFLIEPSQSSEPIACSGTLINPRTVMFAAHCVNDLPENALGSNLRAGWAFQADASAGRNHLTSNDFQTDTALAAFGVNQIDWHPDSLRRSVALRALEADVALATLDTPAADIPTWVTLFSPLPSPDQIDPETGTGYHVNLVGYGWTGSGTGGFSIGLDARRRVAENMLGALTSHDEIDNVILRSSSDRPALVYLLDFDDPEGTYDFDYNFLRDEALPGEGMSAPVDSGSPLILGAANNPETSEDLLIGVASGVRRFLRYARDSGYGTIGFYQPLFPHWDWIVENNPYRYAGAVAGSGDWEDDMHWISLQDPNVRIIDSNGDVLTGLPDRPGAGNEADGPGFGQACIEKPPQDNPLGIIMCADISPPGPDDGWLSPGNLPDPTIENGLPGATGFEPDNRAPDPDRNIDARYFDVTLSEAGVTRLSSEIEIDRLTLAGSAELTIDPFGDLTSLMSITQTGPFTHTRVDGRLATPGDYLLMAGWVSGSDTVAANRLNNVAGVIAPGGTDSLGPLTIDGSVVLSSGSILAIQLSEQGNSSLDITGDISLGGTLALVGPMQLGDRYRIADYGGVATDGFDSILLPGHRGVLTANIIHDGNAVYAEIVAHP